MLGNWRLKSGGKQLKHGQGAGLSLYQNALRILARR
jgi:hypothetical protein